MIERQIDYLQFSANIRESQCIELKYDACYPIKHYKRGYRDGYGSRIYFGNPKSNKALVVQSGEVLQGIRDLGRMDAEIIQDALSIDGKISRLDLAVTEWIEDDLISLWEVEQWFNKGLIESPLCKGGCKEIVEIPEGGEISRETLYIGSHEERAKKGIFRAYDKGIDLGIGNEIVTRLELELKREKAHNTALRIAATNDIAGNFRASFNVWHFSFDRLMDADAVKVQRGKAQKNKEATSEQDKRWAWLIGQVAPGLNKAIQQDVKLGLGDARLTEFLSKAGLIDEMQHWAELWSQWKYLDKLKKGDLE